MKYYLVIVKRAKELDCCFLFCFVSFFQAVLECPNSIRTARLEQLPNSPVKTVASEQSSHHVIYPNVFPSQDRPNKGSFPEITQTRALLCMQVGQLPTDFISLKSKSLSILLCLSYVEIDLLTFREIDLWDFDLIQLSHMHICL